MNQRNRFSILDSRWLVVAVSLLASCAADHSYSFTSHSGGRRPDDSRFTLNWVHKTKSRETGEFLAIAIPYGPLGVSMDVSGKEIEARFAHAERLGRQYYDRPPGAEEETWCDQEHPLQGSVVILSHDVGGVRAALKVDVTCPIKGRFDIRGEHTFETESVFYR